MRFFSNDSNDSRDQSNVDVQTRSEQVNDDQAHDDEQRDHAPSDHVQSDPVAVPQQRSGSPWSDAPGAAPDDTVADRPDTADTPDRFDNPDTSDTADAELSDRERTDGTDEPVTPADDRWDADGGHRDDENRAEDENRADAENRDAGENRDAVDLPLDDRDTDVNTDPATTTDSATTDSATTDSATTDSADDTDRATDEDTTGTTTTYGPDGTVTTDETDSATAAADADTDADVDRVDGDPALQDRGDFDDPQAVDPATDKPLDTDAPDAGETAASETDTVAAADTTPADTSTDTTTADSPSEDTDLAAGEPVPVPVGAADTAAKPGSVTEPQLGSLFGEADAQSFQERWRDVQLRFVDSPKDAATEAAALVDEAVDKLTASLKAQKGAVSHDSDDTEQLRVALRGYREILNRVVGL